MFVVIYLSINTSFLSEICTFQLHNSTHPKKIKSDCSINSNEFQLNKVFCGKIRIILKVAVNKLI